ncbi:CoA pyrophosphatase [uncultured Thiodictyon sp.]|uniref:NUDIX hydrolase n=1 Tax=uncultured Thiodictyon sp. TaxID=1846217 RepID=UPI0025F59AF6|nr:CoA pyrophosphatase [uncultured Thiodictyon sp.]
MSPGACHDGPLAECPGIIAAPTAKAQRAAVLLPLYCRDGAWHLVFIRRAVHAHDRHSGEVGFPGGRWEDRDPDSTATALREAQEEIGLPPERVRVLGRLRPLYTVSQFLVTPVVGEIPWPQPLRPEPREVSRIFSIPLAWLAAPRHHRVRPYPAPGHPQARDLIFFDEYDGELLWGVTARITLDFLGCLTGPGP